MRLAGPILVALCLLLALAPAASAHDEDGPDHIDTPADLRGADITRTLGDRAPDEHVAAQPAPVPPTTWCGSRLTADDNEFAAFPPTQRQIKVVYAYASGQQDGRRTWSEALQADVSNIEQYLAVQTGGGARCASTWAPSAAPQYLDIQVVPLPRAREYYRDDPSNFSRLAARRRGRRRLPRRARATCSSWPTGSPTTAVWGIAQVIDDDRGGAEQREQRGRPDRRSCGPTRRRSPIRRIGGSRR